MELNRRWNYTDPVELVRTMWEDSTKNAVAVAYVNGIIETLLWTGRITADQADDLAALMEARHGIQALG